MSFDLKQKQADLADAVGLKMLEHLNRLLDLGEINSTDLRTLYQILKDNGWTFDKAQIPQSLKDKLTKHVKFDNDDLLDGASNFPVM